MQKKLDQFYADNGNMADGGERKNYYFNDPKQYAKV